MKSSTAIKLSKTWWTEEQPSEIARGAGKSFRKVLGDYEAASAALERAVKAKTEDLSNEIDALKKSVKALDTAGMAVSKEVAKLLKPKSLDKKIRQNLENTLAVVGKPLAKELALVLGSLNSLKTKADSAQAADSDADDTDVQGEEAFKEYLGKTLPLLRKIPHSFAVVMPSSDPKDIRMAFHRTKGGKALAGGLKKSVGGGKFAWGVAGAEQAVEEVDENAASTLLLALDSKVLPGLAKKIKKMLMHVGVKTFKKVKVMVDDQVVETDETGDDDDTALDAENSRDELPEGGSTGAEINPLYASYQKLKQQIEPLIGPAMTRYPDQAEKFSALLKALRAAEKTESYDTGIAILRDRVVPLLKSTQRMAAATDPQGDDIGSVAPPPSAHAARDARLNAGLQKVLERTFPPSGETWFQAFKSGSNKKITSGESFFKDVKVKYPNGQKPANAEQLREWAINMSVLQHMTTQVAPDSPEAKALMKRQLGYLLKFANIPNTGELDWQANPTQVDANTKYHRTGGTTLQSKVKIKVSKDLGVHASTTVLVSDRRVMEEVRRDFTVEKDLETLDDWSDEDYDTVLRHALAGESSFIDCSKLFKAALQANKSPDSQAIALTLKLQERALANAVAAHGKPGMTEAELKAFGEPVDRTGMTEDAVIADKKRVVEEKALKTAIERDHKMALEKLETVRMGGIMAVGETLALTTFPFKASVGAKTTQLALQNADQEKMKGLVGHSGFTVGPEQLLDHWVSQTPNTVQILQDLGVTQLPTVTFPSGRRLDQFDDFDADFMQSKPVDGFKMLADDDKEPPYVRVMVDGMISMVEGLQLGDKGFSVQSCLKKAGLDELWAISLNKIQGLMAKATACKGSMRDFLDQIALIQEEVATLIAVAKPYSKDDFKQGMLDTTEMFPKNFLGDDVTAEFSLKNSASRCFNSVLTACEDSKELLQGEAQHLAKRGLSVLVQGDSYYEPSMYVLDHANDHSQTALNTDGLQQGGTEKDFDDQLDEMLRAQTEDNKAKLDTYLCEFHHNISYDRKQYSPEDVTKQVRKLIDKGVVARPFTVAIDTTIAKTDEKNVKNFLRAFKSEIKDGDMNVVIYRSAQKFDQMGADTYNGGIMCCITANGDEPSPFQRALDSAGELPSEDNMQGLTHLNLSGQDEINAYRTGIMENTRKIGDPNSGSPAAIPAEMLRTPANDGKSLVQIAINDDDEAPFLDIKLPFCDTSEGGLSKTYADAAYGQMQKLFLDQAAADPENAVASTRASFGFQHTNVTLIDGEKLRVNPGLEDEARLKTNTDTLVAVNDLLMDVIKDLQGSDHFSKDQLDELIYYSEMISLPVVTAHKELTAILKDNAAKDKKKDAARLKLAEAWCPTQTGTRCANPPGVLKLLDEMSDSFQRKNAQRIQVCRDVAARTTGKMKSQDETLLAQAKAAKTRGHVKDVKDALAAIDSDADAFAPKIAEYNALQTWVSDNQATWSDQSEAELQTALAAQKARDTIGASTALKQIPDAFKTLRQADCARLENWITETNEKTAKDLIGNVQDRLDAGLADTIAPYLARLEHMHDSGAPGVPDDLDQKIATFKQREKTHEVLRQIDQALNEAAAFELPKQIVEAKKRFDWAQNIMSKASGIATDTQKTRLGDLKGTLAGSYSPLITRALTKAETLSQGDETNDFAQSLAAAGKLIKNAKGFVSEDQTAQFARLENMLST